MLNPDYHTQIFFDVARCLLLSGIVTLLGGWIGSRLPRTLDWRQWAIILAPLCTPTLLVSYTYASLGLHLSGAPWLLNLLYSTLVALKLIPIAVLARRLFPPPISAEARYCASLLPGRSLSSRLAFHTQALGVAPWMTTGLVFLLAFADFELASLLSVKTWSVILFDAHVRGLHIWESLRGAFAPLYVELAVVVALVLLGRRAVPGSPANFTGGSGSGSRWTFFVMALISILTSAWPIIRTVGQSIPGWTAVGLRYGMSEIMTSTAVAVGSTFAIWIAFDFINRRTTRLVLALPGLLGALVLSLLFVALLNTGAPGFVFGKVWRKEWDDQLRILADSPLPLIFAEALLLAPVALLLKSMLKMRRPAEALHLARMAGSRRLLWELALQPSVAAIGLLFFLSYFEFTAASILAPVDMTPACVRLHNLAHYGQTSALSAMMLSAMLVPFLLLALTLGAARLYARQDAR